MVTETKLKIEDLDNNNLSMADRSVKKMFMYITKKCNLACKYCYLETTDPKGDYPEEINIKEAKIGVRLLLESNGKLKHFRFMGGEPLIRFELIKDIVKYIRGLEKEYNKKVCIEIATNGTIITEDIISFVKKNDVDIHFSIDGIKEIQLQNRPSKYFQDYYERIISNLGRLKKEDVNVKCNFVIMPETVNTFPNTIKFLISQGIKHISYEPAMGVTRSWSEGALIDLNNHMKKIIRIYQNKLVNKDIQIDPFQGINALKYINDQKMYNKFYSVGCERHLTINSKGKINNCPGYPDEIDKRFILGDLKKDSFEKIKSDIRVDYLYFQDKKKHKHFCRNHCVKDIKLGSREEDMSQRVHELCVVKPIFYNYMYMINYNFHLFNDIIKNNRVNTSEMFLSIMPRFIDNSEGYFFLKNNKTTNIEDIKLIDLNKKDLMNIDIRKVQDDDVAIKGFVPACKMKKMDYKGKTRIKNNLVPLSCMGCSYFLKLKGDRIETCGGDSFELKKFNLYSALLTMKNHLIKCKDADCFGHCKYEE